ncbi:MAG: hypothetical protein AAFW88_07335 [Pseudomonadota bacterium]
MPHRLLILPLLLLSSLLFFAGSAAAQQDVFVPEVERRYIDAEEFRARFENHTVHLTLRGRHYGSEYYLPGDRSIWIAAEGPCEDGVWDYAQTVFCFRYPGHSESCWRVFEAQGSFWAESVQGLLLRIVAVEARPLNCQPELFS